MKYNGKFVVEISPEQWDELYSGKTRAMLVWDEYDDEAQVREVLEFSPGVEKWLCRTSDLMNTILYDHCGEIPSYEYAEVSKLEEETINETEEETMSIRVFAGSQSIASYTNISDFDYSYSSSSAGMMHIEFKDEKGKTHEFLGSLISFELIR